MAAALADALAAVMAADWRLMRCCERFFTEGYVSVMGDVEASTSWQEGLVEKADAKRHDMRPATSYHAIPWHPAQNQVTKRSIKRAYKRACTFGLAWYIYSPRFPQMLEATIT